MVRKTKRRNLWSGWSKVKPKTRKAKKKMFKKCGQKCFLFENLKFPICKVNTCDIDKRGIWAAYIRAKQWEKRIPKYKRVSRKAKKLLKKYK